MESNAVGGEILSISKALDSLDSAFLPNSTLVATIRNALLSFKNAIRVESFLDSAAICSSQQWILEEAALESSLQQLSGTLTDVQLRVTALKQSVTSSPVVIPPSLTNAKEVATALNLAVSGRKIHWSLANKALNSLVFLTTRKSTNVDLEPRKLLVKEIWEMDHFMTDIMQISRSGSVEMSTCISVLNTILGQYKNDLSCSNLFFDTLGEALLQLKSPAAVQKERLLLLLIARKQSRHIGDDALRLIHDFVYSHKKTIDIASNSLEIFSTLSRSYRNNNLFFTSRSISTALLTTITNYKNNRNICYHGCVIAYYLPVLNINKTEADKLLDAGKG
jgi:hypothetical protein